MAVLLETSAGDITIDLLLDQAPKACENFLKLCKIKYFNYTPIHTINRNHYLQTGDPIGPNEPGSDGGSSIWGVLNGPSQRTFVPEFDKKLKHAERGTVSFVTAPSPDDPDRLEAGSQFIITLGDDMERFDGKAAIFGRVAEGFDVLEEKINTAFVDANGRPLKDIRILHTIVLEETDIPDPPGLIEPATSPVPTPAQLATVRIAHDETLEEETDPEALEKTRRAREARAQALTLEMVGDLPFAEVAPPENVLFVCKLNPVTQGEDLELIFGRFGKILSCEVIRDKKTGDSLQYAFIEFAEKSSCELAYSKMEEVLIDDHRIHVDFSQSVSRLADVWRDGENTKRKSRGGFGGVANLEKRRQYRAEEDRPSRNSDYGMVFDKNNGSRNRSRDRHRERSPPPPRHHGRDEYRRRSRSREKPRYHDDRYRDDRKRDKEYDRDRRHDRDRYQDRERHRDRERRRHD